MSKLLNLDNKIKNDIKNVNNKIQAAYAFSLVIISTFVITMNIASINKLAFNILDDISLFTAFGALASIPVFWLQDRMAQATERQLKISNYILDLFFIILTLFFMYNIYSLFLII